MAAESALMIGYGMARGQMLSLREDSHLEDSEWDRLGKFFRTEGTSKEKAPGNWNINKPYADRNFTQFTTIFSDT